MATPLPDKLFFKIGEVADLVGVKPHVLRYWETEFAALRPLKTRGSHRMYKRRDVELAMLIRQLLHDDGFTISGARKRIRELRRDESKNGDAKNGDAAKHAETRNGETKPRHEQQELPIVTEVARADRVATARSETERASREVSLRAELLAVREQLSVLLSTLQEPEHDLPQVAVTITSVAPMPSRYR